MCWSDWATFKHSSGSVDDLCLNLRVRLDAFHMAPCMCSIPVCGPCLLVPCLVRQSSCLLSDGPRHGHPSYMRAVHPILHRVHRLLTQYTEQSGFLWKFGPFWVQLWHWSDLTFIEPSVMKLDYGKVSASDISSFNTALRYEKLHERI